MSIRRDEAFSLLEFAISLSVFMPLVTFCSSLAHLSLMRYEFQSEVVGQFQRFKIPYSLGFATELEPAGVRLNLTEFAQRLDRVESALDANLRTIAKTHDCDVEVVTKIAPVKAADTLSSYFPQSSSSLVGQDLRNRLLVFISITPELPVLRLLKDYQPDLFRFELGAELRGEYQVL